MNSEKQLLSLIKAAQTLTSTLDLDKVLDQLIYEVVRVIEGADAVILFIYDKKLGRLVPKGGHGFDMSYMKRILLCPNEGMTGKTFSSKKARIFTYYNDTSDGMANIIVNNQKYYQKALGRFQFPISAICAPLLTKDECIGVLTIDSFSANIHFSERDLTLLETFAAQASIAIENATLFSQIERSKKIHTELTKVSLAQRGLEEITSTLSHLLDKKIGIYNEFVDLLAYSSEETRNLASRLKTIRYTLLKEATKKPTVSYYCVETKSDNINVYLFPIRADQVTIGLLSVFVNQSVDLDSLDFAAIDQAINIFALEMIGQERVLVDHYKYEGYLLEQLLNKQMDPTLFKQESKQDFSNHDTYIFAHLYIHSQNLTLESFNQTKQTLSHLLYRELSSFKYKTFILDYHWTFKLLFIIHDLQEEDKVFDELKKFFQAVYHKSLHLDRFKFMLGLGRLFTTLNDIQLSSRDSARCIDYLKIHQTDQTMISYKQLGIYRLFLKQEREELQDFVNDKLGKLIVYCTKHGFDYLKTLKVYLESHQNMTKTAKQCFVHLNTIKYRLGVIKDILKISDLNGSILFELQLAIYLFEFIENRTL